MKLDRLDLIKIHDIGTYLDLLMEYRSQYAIIISVRDTAGSRMPIDIIERIKKLGFKEFNNELWLMYVGVSYENNILVDCRGIKPEDKVEVDLQINGLNLSISSESWRNGNRASILVDGLDYACNRRGLNIVVYDIENNMPIDSICYDSHDKKISFYREKSVVDKRIWFNSKDKYDVCVLGVWYGANFGSLLNGYAIYNILRQLNKSVLMVKKPDCVVDDVELLEECHNTKFVECVYPKEALSPRMTTKDMGMLNLKADTFISGSDQIWNYRISFGGLMYLPFVDDSKKRISFCSSFGDLDDYVPLEKTDSVCKCLKKYDAISVREAFGKKILQEKYGVSAEVLLEPVFDIDPYEYERLIGDICIEKNNRYAVAYILDPTYQKLEIIQEVEKNLGIEIITIPDGFYKVIDCTWEHFSEPEKYPNIQLDMSVGKFLALYKNAEFILTDSFHGTCFAIIFKKRFITICNLSRGKERFTDLLGRFDLLDRMIIDENGFRWDDKFGDFIDYKSVNQTIEMHRQEAKKWLKSALDTPIRNNTVEKTIDMRMCVGCASCANVCPKEAIVMSTDEYGYFVPRIQKDKCVDCGLCSKVCPTHGVKNCTNKKEPTIYEFQSGDKQILHNSSSGGFFTIIADWVLNENGVVCGAAWGDDFKVEHIIVDNIKDLEKLNKSKYMQSYISPTLYKQIEDMLKEERKVLFTGCPCQIAGIKNYLQEEYDNLILIDILCGNAPSQMFFKKYMSDDVPKDIAIYEFRTKVPDWKSDCVTLTLTSGERMIRHGGAQDEYQRLYHNHTMCPEHCEKCKYQSFPRLGDFTMGDFWWISSHDKSIDDFDGISAVITNNKKAEYIYMMISENYNIAVNKKAKLEWLNGNGNYKGNWAGKQRNLFYEKIITTSFHDAANYALKPNHGYYRDIYKSANSLLQYDCQTHRFEYEPSIWEQHVIKGMLMLVVLPDKCQSGKYATMNMGRELEKDKLYVLNLKFKVKTKSPIINFHIKDSGSNYYQVICSQNIINQNDGKQWITISKRFTPNSNIFDQFMIGASQISGSDNYIVFQYINIQEE